MLINTDQHWVIDSKADPKRSISKKADQCNGDQFVHWAFHDLSRETCNMHQNNQLTSAKLVNSGKLA